MKKKANIVDIITMAFVRLSSVLLLVLVLLIVVNVVGRKLFNSPISGTVELVEYGILVVMALAISRTGFEGRHLSVTLVHELLPKKIAAVLKCVCQLIAGGLFAVLMVSYVIELPKSLASGRVSSVLHMPYYIVSYLLVVAMFIVALAFIYQAFLAIYTGFFQTGGNTRDDEEGGAK